MNAQNSYDVIIVGGSYAGLSAAMALGRSLRKVLIIDSGLPCNRQTPHSHNFITHDGHVPADIAAAAREQVSSYPTVSFLDAMATSGQNTSLGFLITADNGQTYQGTKLIFATGIKDIMPDIPGFSECWGISVIHCPYCHGYEYRQRRTGIFANGDMAMHLAQLVSNLTSDLTIFTHGAASFTAEQRAKLDHHRIQVIEDHLAAVIHDNGYLRHVVLEGGKEVGLDALYAKLPFQQHCAIPEQLGCEMTDLGFIKVDSMQKTTVDGVFACGDNASPMRALSAAIAAGNMAGAAINREMVEASF